MVKFLLIPLNLFFLFGISTFIKGDLSIEQKAPNRIPVQGTCEVELIINKADVAGFAKLQQAFPSGVTVEAIETKGATFTFADQKMKWIWMALPQEETFSIKYKLTVEDEYLTEVELGGTFSYLDKNERKSFFIPAQLLPVGEEIKPEDLVKEPVVSTTREITNEGNGNYKVDVTIVRKHVSGFAKVQEYIPEGVSATAIAEEQAVFSVVNNKVKFVWMNLPEGDEFTVSYRLSTGGGNLDERSISGEFAYIHDGQTMKAAIPSEGAQTNTEPVLANSNTTNNVVEEQQEEPMLDAVATESQSAPVEEASDVVAINTGTKNTTEPLQPVEKADEPNEELAVEPIKEEPAVIQEQTPEEEPVVASNQNKTTDVAKKTVTTIPMANKGINYRVQILAGHNNVKEAYFEKEFSYTGQYIVETHEGWMKYTTGNHPQYQNARDQRENIKSSYTFPGPFVVAYNNGERITVQEALMITNQKWVK